MPQKKTIAQVVEEIFETRQEPLHYVTLTKYVMEQLDLTGASPDQTVRSVVGHSTKFKRVAEGVYCPADWDQPPRARFGKDIAYEVLQRKGRPMTYAALGKAIFEERKFTSDPSVVARNSTRNDPRFYKTTDSNHVGLSKWLRDAPSSSK